MQNFNLLEILLSLAGHGKGKLQDGQLSAAAMSHYAH